MTLNTPHLPVHNHTVQVGALANICPPKAPVYPSSAVTSGWTPFNIYPCGFHRSAAQARQTLLIKTGACFKGPHSGRQSALARQKSPGHVAAGKPELDALFRLHFPPLVFFHLPSSTALNPGNTPVASLDVLGVQAFVRAEQQPSTAQQAYPVSLGGPGQNSWTWITHQKQRLDTVKNTVLLDLTFLWQWQKSIQEFPPPTTTKLPLNTLSY